MQLTEELGDRQGLAWCHHELAHLDRLSGDPQAARDHLTKELEINQGLGSNGAALGSPNDVPLVLSF